MSNLANQKDVSRLLVGYSTFPSLVGWSLQVPTVLVCSVVDRSSVNDDGVSAAQLAKLLDESEILHLLEQGAS
ncbi:hypothetical protein QYS36_15080 [Pseudomonas sp. G34]|uniref:hypothetical protein n=1 Tax=Pseudomonas sp. G34 TaxID=3059083 RepID=UPI0028082893|nr:hypothetical protein [Pseudomonas sp. G34]MDQ7986261.1 hypothetical protein [Pseudomonas sp. G34]